MVDPMWYISYLVAPRGVTDLLYLPWWIKKYRYVYIIVHTIHTHHIPGTRTYNTYVHKYCKRNIYLHTYSTRAPNERVWRITQPCKVEFQPPIGRTHSCCRFSFFYKNTAAAVSYTYHNLLIRAKRVSDCYMQEKKNWPFVCLSGCSDNLLVLVWKNCLGFSVGYQRAPGWF